MTDLTREGLDAILTSAFNTLYPTLPVDAIVHNDDETIDVMVRDVTTMRANIESDDDGYLYFHPHDPDYDAEFPDEDPADFVMIRVKVLS